MVPLVSLAQAVQGLAILLTLRNTTSPSVVPKGGGRRKEIICEVYFITYRPIRIWDRTVTQSSR